MAVVLASAGLLAGCGSNATKYAPPLEVNKKLTGTVTIKVPAKPAAAATPSPLGVWLEHQRRVGYIHGFECFSRHAPNEVECTEVLPGGGKRRAIFRLGATGKIASVSYPTGPAPPITYTP